MTLLLVALCHAEDPAVAPAAALAAPAPPGAEPPTPPPPLRALPTFGGVVDGTLVYDEPLFPVDPVEPILASTPALPLYAP